MRLNKLDLEGNEANLSLNGLIEEAGRFNGIAKLQNLDLSQWILNTQKTGISGYLLLDGSFKEMLITSLDLNADVSESIRFKNEPSSFSGGISYSDSMLTIFNPVTLSIGKSLVAVDGYADYANKLLNLNVDLTEASSSLINYFWSDTLKGGKATGSMKIDGAFDKTSLDADLVINDFEYSDITLSNFELNAEINDLNNHRTGVVKTKFNNDEKIVCFLGFGRSGSLFLHSLLDGHPQISTLPGYFFKGWFSKTTWPIFKPNTEESNWRENLAKKICILVIRIT